jgi:ABC-type branched-subunit amino acid transport system ATPase component
MLSVENLEAYYGTCYVVQRISLRIPEGKSVALLGRNGAGKTTALKAIMGMGPQVRGTINFKGKDVTNLKPFRKARLGIGFVPEDRRIYQDISVADNLAVGRYAATGRSEPFPMEYVLETFPLLARLRNRKGGQLSGGEQQMLSVARTFMGRPEVVLMDEPAEGLAPLIVKELAGVIRDFCKKWNMAILLAEQNLWFSHYCTEYVYLIDGGRIVFEGSWADFHGREHLKREYLAI